MRPSFAALGVGVALLAPSPSLAAQPPAEGSPPAATFPSEPAEIDTETTADPAPAAPAAAAPTPAAAAPAPAAAPPAPEPVAASPAPIAEPVQAPPLPPSQTSQAKPKPRHKVYASLGVGPGLLHATSGSQTDRRTFSGGSLSTRIAIGAKASSNVVVGAAFFYDRLYDVSAEDELIDADEPNLEDVSFSFTMLGFLTDVYLRAEGGPHFELVLGLGTLNLSRTGANPESPGGMAFGIGAGYDLRLGDVGSLGVLLRTSYGMLSVDEGSGGTMVETWIPALLVTGSIR